MQQLLGHVSISTTQVYRQLADGSERRIVSVEPTVPIGDLDEFTDSALGNGTELANASVDG